jgi:hypothetical protein
VLLGTIGGGVLVIVVVVVEESSSSCDDKDGCEGDATPERSENENPASMMEVW